MMENETPSHRHAHIEAPPIGSISANIERLFRALSHLRESEKSQEGASEYQSAIFEIYRLSSGHVAELVHKMAVDKGWWDDPKPIPTLIALMHSELCEALEADRMSAASEKLKCNLGIEEELADVIIRILDAAAGYDLDVHGAIIAKMLYNETREDRHGGKRY